MRIWLGKAGRRESKQGDVDVDDKSAHSIITHTLPNQPQDVLQSIGGSGIFENKRQETGISSRAFHYRLPVSKGKGISVGIKFYRRMGGLPVPQVQEIALSN